MKTTRRERLLWREEETMMAVLSIMIVGLERILLNIPMKIIHQKKNNKGIRKNKRTPRTKLLFSVAENEAINQAWKILILIFQI